MPARSSWFVAVLVATVACLGLVGGSAASPSHAAAVSGRIVFEESSTPCPGGNCRTHIAVMNANGSGRKVLTTNVYGDTAPHWSPNGRLIAFTRRTKGGTNMLELMRSNGTGLRMLARTTNLNHGAPDFTTTTWSANGRAVLYVEAFVQPKCSLCPSVTRYGLMAVNAHGKLKPRRLFMLPGANRAVGFPAVDWFRPSASPDGRWIALARSIITRSGEFIELWIVHPNGTGLRRLVRATSDLTAFAFSPDGKELAYGGFFPQYGAGCTNGNPETDYFQTVWVVPVGGGAPKPMWNMQCDNAPAPTDFLPEEFNTISWPDDDHIAYPTTDWTQPSPGKPANETKFGLVLHVVDTTTGVIAGIPNSKPSSNNCHGGQGSANSPCLLTDPSWTK